jgi:hypothetical protein
MSNFMMNLISWILLLLVILTLYLIDKVNHLTRMYDAPKPEIPSQPEVVAQIPGDLLFSGLEDKKLWDAMNGKQVDGVAPTLVDALRPHYEPIIREHITAVFKEGMEDAVSGIENNPPKSTREISTLRGHIQSWLPPQHLGSIYRAAFEFAGSYCQNPDPQVLLRLQQTVDSVVDMLYQRVGLSNEVPFSEFLFEVVPVSAPEQDSPSESLGIGLLENSDVSEPQSINLAQGLEHVQAYEDQQRQEFAAQTVDAVMHPEVLEASSEQSVHEHQQILEAKPV